MQQILLHVQDLIMDKKGNHSANKLDTECTATLGICIFLNI